MIANPPSPPRPAPLRTALEPRRLQILQLVWDRELAVGEIAERLPVTIGAVSQHLSKLRTAGLVTMRKDGQRRLYRASKSDMGSLAVVLESFWKGRLDALGPLARSLEAGATAVPTSTGESDR